MIQADLEIHYNKFPVAIKVTGPNSHKLRCAYSNPYARRKPPLLPLCLAAVENILAPRNVELSSRLLEWIDQEKQRREQQQALIEELSFDERLRDYQRIGVGHALGSQAWSHGVQSLLADDPRLGKTPQALCIANSLQTPVLITTMKPLIEYWLDSVSQWTNFTPAHAGLGTIKQRLELLSEAKKGHAYVTNWETLRKVQGKLKPTTFKTIIGDESHVIRNRKAQVTQGFLSLQPRHKILLSATPTERGAQDYFTSLSFLNPIEFGSYWRFVDWFCVLQNNGFGQEIVANQNQDILQDLLYTRVLRRRLEDVTDPPERIFETVKTGFQESLRPTYTDLVKSAIVVIEDERFNVSNKLAEMTRLRQISTCPRVLGLKEKSPKDGVTSSLVEKYKNFQCVIFSSFNAAIEDLCKELAENKISFTRYTGDTEQEEEFKSGRTQCLVTNPAIGGIGLDFSNARIMIFYDTPLSSTLLRQSLARLTKIGLKDTQMIFFLSSTPIEQYISNLIAQKQSAVEEVDILYALREGMKE